MYALHTFRIFDSLAALAKDKYHLRYDELQIIN